MEKELIIEKHGQGNAVVVFESRKIIDFFIDPPFDSNFYPPNTFVEAKIQRRISKRGGYFVALPSGNPGFLKSKTNYQEGEPVVLLSKVFFDENKPQTFTDKLKIISRFFILKLGDEGFSFSKKISKNIDKELLIPILESKIKDHDDIFVICRSLVADISAEQFNDELDKVFLYQESIKKELLLKKRYCDGLAKRTALAKYNVDSSHVFEEEGIFERLGLWNKIDDLCKKKHFFHNDSYLILEQTSSFFVIDVNSGKDLTIGVKELNLLACSEICRLIKILGFGGKIIIDFLPCSKLEKKEIYGLIKDFFLDNDLRNKIWGWTNGGAFELEKEREKSPLELLLDNN